MGLIYQFDKSLIYTNAIRHVFMHSSPKMTTSNHLLPFSTLSFYTCPPDYGLFTCAGYPGSFLHIEQDAKVTHLLKWLT